MADAVLSKLMFGTVMLAAYFVVLYAAMEPVELVLVLNAAFVGVTGGLAWSYREIICALFRFGALTLRVRLQTVSLMILWIVVGTGVVNSVYLRCWLDADIPATPAIAFMRFGAIVAAVIQIAAANAAPETLARPRRETWALPLIVLALAAGTYVLERLL